MEVTLAITVDIENDGIALQDERSSLTWEGLVFVPKIKELMIRLGIPVTWFVRADNQLDDLFGTPAYLLERLNPLLEEFQKSGDEIGWHPHLYSLQPNGHHYIADLDDAGRVYKLETIHRQLTAAGFAFNSVRIGEAMQSNAMMVELVRLGLRVDASAIPGRIRNDPNRHFDWGATPNAPYHPSACDYRIPGETDALSILEVPMTTMPVQAPYDPRPLPRYINPVFTHSFFREGFQRLLNNSGIPAGTPRVISLILHADELVQNGGNHPLYSFSLQEIEKNLVFVREELEKRSYKIRYSVLGDVPRLMETGEGG